MLDPVNFGAIEVRDSGRFHLTNKKVIDFFAVPMRIADFIGWTCADEQFVGVIWQGLKQLAGLMLKEAESALQAASDLGITFLPATVLRNRENLREIVTAAKLFEHQISRRRR